MENPVYLYNSLSRKKENFIPLNTPFVGMYVCGPTVYGDAHLGHARSAIAFDLVFRYLRHLNYKVRYVRNITDVGHLENDADEGEDKIGKKARLESLEPMEVVQYYMDAYHHDMDRLNMLKPSIEPRASAHIPEQISLVKKIIAAGYAYESNGSVYFDVLKYSKSFNYGELSGRILDDLIAGAGNLRRELEGQSEKRNPADFALWKKASAEHIMHWESPWSEGFPGWHLECTAMSEKYLGEAFDIHGGGMDLLFPHHESEIAQSTACTGHGPSTYWMHNNMITINGQKMGKSLGNSITLRDFFSGKNPLLKKSYSPMTIRFFILQGHYRSTLDFSNEALEASEKGLKRLINAYLLLEKIKPGQKNSVDIPQLIHNCYTALNDDFNSPIVIAELFEASRIINLVYNNDAQVDKQGLDDLRKMFRTFMFDILGIRLETEDHKDLKKVLDILIDIRDIAKQNKDYTISDSIRNRLLEAGYQLKDSREETTWSKI